MAAVVHVSLLELTDQMLAARNAPDELPKEKSVNPDPGTQTSMHDVLDFVGESPGDERLVIAFERLVCAVNANHAHVERILENRPETIIGNLPISEIAQP